LRGRIRLGVESLEPRRVLEAGPVISEFMALNDGGLVDSFGEHSDWIEIHNPTSAGIQLDGWYLTDNASNLTKWRFPAVTLAAGGQLVVFASSRDRRDPAAELHTNFALSGAGEYLALVRPNGSTVASAYAPTFPGQYTDVSYGRVAGSTRFVSAGDTAAYVVPTPALAGAGWQAPAFDDAGWARGPTGIGAETASGFTVDYYKANIQVGTTAIAESVVATPARQTKRVTASYPTINFYGTGNNYGLFPGDVAFPDQTMNVNTDDFIMVATTKVFVPAAGVWTFGVRSDDGFKLTVFNGQTNVNVEFAGTRGPADTLETVSFAAPGMYSLRLLCFDRGGGSMAELFAAPGTHYAFDADVFRLVGDRAAGGLAVAGFGGVVQTDVAAALVGVNTSLWSRIRFTMAADAAADTLLLRMKYTDGFVAYLNGTEVARANAPANLSHAAAATATRSPVEATVWSSFDISQHRGLLVTGPNVLAIHALNDAVSDRDLLVLPELVGLSGAVEIGHLSEASPGSPNVATVVRYVAPVTASHERGFRETAFDLVLATATPQAQIRYTLDGSEPTPVTGLAFVDPIRIDRTTTLRAAAFRPGWETPEIATHTYIFLDDVVRQSPVGQPPATPGPNGFSATFDATAEGFVYADDLLGTSNPAKASGGHAPTGGQAGGGLAVDLGPGPTGAASGGLSRTFTVERGGLYGVWLRYRMVVGPDLATDEFGELVLRVNGARYGAGTGTSLVRRSGDGAGGSAMDTGWQTYGFNITLAAGTHTLQVAAFLSDADTSAAKWLAGSFDEVIVGTWPAATVNSQVVDYGMDPDIVENATWGPQLRAALGAIPTISITTDIANLYDPTLGIYANPQSVGRGWERPVSMELINPGGAPGFQVEAGMRIRGGYSSSPANPKHSMRFFFRREYGDASLAFPLFGTSGTDEFEKIDFRTSQNYSWSFAGSGQNAFVRDVFARDTQAAMGQPHTRSVSYHVYINGRYYGLFETQERADANHAAAYLGGEAEDYDVVKPTHHLGYVIEATDGTLDAWQDLWNQAGGRFTATSYLAGSAVTTPAQAEAVIATTALQSGSPVTVAADRINYRATGSGGRYGSDATLPGLPAGVAAPDMVLAVTGTIEIPTVGDWTFGVHTAGGFRLELWNATHRFSMQAERGPAPTDTLAVFVIPAAGSYHVRLVHFQAAGEAGVELFAAPGTRAAFDAAVFRLVGDAASGGLARATLAGNAAYLRVLGRDPDGSLNPLFPKLVDVDNLADYMTVIFYGGNTDAPISNFLGNNRPNNWYGAYNRLAPDGFKFFAHDSEHTLKAGSAGVDRTGPYPAGDEFSYSNPQWVHQQLMANAEYRLRFADRAQAHLVAPGGALTPAVAAARYQARMDEIAAAVIAESARWGDAKRAAPFTKTDWVSATNADLVHMQTRGGVLLNQLKVTKLRSGALAPLFPALTAPVLGQHGGRVSGGYPLSISGTGTLYYTLDGSDPRLFGGGVSPTSRVFSGSLPITTSGRVSVRSLNGGEWSPLTAATFEVGAPAAAGLVAITEINYQAFLPTVAEQAAGFTDVRDFDFIELQNVAAGPVDLTGASFNQGITFSFTGAAVTTLAPGGFVIVARNPAAFAVRYGAGLPVAGGYTGQLDNAGERVTLIDRAGATIATVRYRIDQGWPTRAAGFGSSLEIINAAGLADDAANWRASIGYGGSPGFRGTSPPAVVINEVLAHTDLPQIDTIELLNRSTTPIDVGGWYLSDSRANLFQYRFPTAAPGQTVIPAGGYLLINATVLGFNFSSLGEEAWLVSADTGGRPLAFVDDVAFGATPNGESLGRWPDGSGVLQPMTTPTFGAANAGPRVGPVVVSELMYAPQPPTAAELAIVPGLLATDLEFVEIFNPRPSPIDLTRWQLRSGISYDFAAGTLLPARSTVVILPFDPRSRGDLWQVFARRYLGGAMSVPTTFAGPYTGRLENAGELVQLLSPDAPQPEDPAIVPRILADEVDYRPTAPWPALPATTDGALTRATPGSWGRDAASWAMAVPSPGAWEAGVLSPLTVPAGVEVEDALEWTGAVPLVKRGAGRLILGRANRHTGGTIVEAGEVVVRNQAALGSGRVEVRSGATLRLELGTARIDAANLDLHAGARIDLGYGGIQIAPGQVSEAAIRQALVSARAGGAWNGPGIGTAHAGADRAVGYRTMATGAIVVAWAAAGDANMDGRVNFSDLSMILDSGRYGSAGGWWQGDFNYDGRVNFSDMGLLISTGLFNGGSYTEGLAEPRGVAALVQDGAPIPSDEPAPARLASVTQESPASWVAPEPARVAVDERQLQLQVLAAGVSMEPTVGHENTVRRRLKFRPWP
jgi:autotransporter-associated beta strand protein